YRITSQRELSAERRTSVDEHVRGCSYCQDDVAWQKRGTGPKIAVTEMRRWLGYGAVALAAGVALVALLPLLVRPNRPVSPYADLARIPLMNRSDLIAKLHRPQRYRPALEESLNAYDARDYRLAATRARAILQTSPGDPSALFVAAMSEYQQGKRE